MALSQLQCTVQKWIHFFGFSCYINAMNGFLDDLVLVWSKPMMIQFPCWYECTSFKRINVHSIFIPKSAFQRSHKKTWLFGIMCIAAYFFHWGHSKNLKQKKKGTLFMKCRLYRVAARISLVLAEFNFKLACVVFSNLAVSVSCNDRLEPTLPIYHVSLLPLYQCQTRVALDCATENVPAHQNFPWNNT